jgi:hypothetical protein
MTPRIPNRETGKIEQADPADLLDVMSSDEEDEMAWAPISPEMEMLNTVNGAINDIVDDIIDDEERCFLGNNDAIWRNFTNILSFVTWLFDHVRRTNLI